MSRLVNHMTPVELLQINPGLIQRLIDETEYSVSHASVHTFGKLFIEFGVPLLEVANLLQEIGNANEEHSRPTKYELSIDVGGIHLNSRLGVWDISLKSSSEKSRFLPSIMQNFLENHDGTCMYLDCDGSFHCNPRRTECANAVRVFRIHSLVDLVATVDKIYYDMDEDRIAPSSLVIVNSVTAILWKSSFEDARNNRQLVSHFVATCDRINQTFGTGILLINHPDNPSVYPRFANHYRGILNHMRHQSIEIYD